MNLNEYLMILFFNEKYRFQANYYKLILPLLVYMFPTLLTTQTPDRPIDALLSPSCHWTFFAAFEDPEVMQSIQLHYFPYLFVSRAAANGKEMA